MRVDRFGPFAPVLAACAILSGLPVRAQDDTEQPPAQDKSALRAALEHMQRLELRNADGQRIDPVERPLLSYADPARINSDGTFWAWGKTGRPVAFLELFRGSPEAATWVQSATLTTAQRVKLIIPEVGLWQPPPTPVEPRAIPDAPTPDERPTSRLRQIKDLSRRFAAHEFWDPDNSRFELRVLVRPVLRYSDPTANIQDGAAFVIAHGTNPETVLLIEAIGPSLKEARWHYALVRSSHAEAHVELDGQEVWKCERANAVNHGATRGYWLFLSPVEEAVEP
ncbi:MAG TPA: hypothetical protein VHC22_16885 [Pirellulales bacterium]|nr:hypothetical protein [Pirellulales bacterium]